MAELVPLGGAGVVLHHVPDYDVPAQGDPAFHPGGVAEPDAFQVIAVLGPEDSHEQQPQQVLRKLPQVEEYGYKFGELDFHKVGMESDDFDGDVFAFVGRGLHQAIDLLEAGLALGELPDLGVLPHQDAAPRVEGAGAGMDEDPVEAGDVQQPRHLALAELPVPGHGRVLRRGDVHGHLVGPLGDGGLAGNLPLLDVQQRVVLLQATVLVLEGVAVEDAVDVQAADGVGGLGPPALDRQLHQASSPWCPSVSWTSVSPLTMRKS